MVFYITFAADDKEFGGMAYKTPDIRMDDRFKFALRLFGHGGYCGIYPERSYTSRFAVNRFSVIKAFEGTRISEAHHRAVLAAFPPPKVAMRI